MINKNQITATGKRFSGILVGLVIFITILFSVQGVVATQSAVNLGTAGDFVILSKSGISTTGTTTIVGNIGVSPIDSTAITGFGLIMDSSNEFSTSSLVTGKIYAADYTAPTPTKMTTAVSDMETAYTDAAGRTLPDATELGAGDISGMTITPGLYKWGTGVLINNGVTLNCQGNADSVFIFQIAQDLILGNGAIITLSNGCQAKNIFWQVGGQATLGTTSDFKGNILSQTLIEINTGARLNGRALAQTAVTLDANAIAISGTASSSQPITTVVTPINLTPVSSNSNSNAGSTSKANTSVNGNAGSSLNVQTNANSSKINSSGIGQSLSQQITEKRTEYKSGNFTTSLGQFLNVKEIVAGLLELRDKNISVRTKLNLTQVKNGSGSKLEVKLSNGRNAEIKIMPSSASEIALARLRIKVCNETNKCTIELKEVGSTGNEKVEYNIQIERHSKILGIFEKKMQVSVEVDAETGNVMAEHKPWWAFIATEPAE